MRPPRPGDQRFSLLWPLAGSPCGHHSCRPLRGGARGLDACRNTEPPQPVPLQVGDLQHGVDGSWSGRRQIALSSSRCPDRRGSAWALPEVGILQCVVLW